MRHKGLKRDISESDDAAASSTHDADDENLGRVVMSGTSTECCYGSMEEERRDGFVDRGCC